MRLTSFGYLAKQGWKSMAANRLMSLASIGVLTACLIITGIATLVSVNVNSLIEFFGEQNEIMVYLELDVTEGQTEAILYEIENMPNVHSVDFVSQDAAMEEMRGVLEEYADLLDDMEDWGEKLQASFRVTVADLNFVEQVDTRLKNIPGVERTRAAADVTDVMLLLKKTINFGGWALVIILGVVSLIVISNTIRLTVFARRREISIMKYVGATNAFIRLPFFIEGLTVGLVSGVLAAGAVCGAYYLVLDFFSQSTNFWFLSFADRIYPFEQVWKTVLLGFAGFGALVGGLGTTASIRKHLKV